MPEVKELAEKLGEVEIPVEFGGVDCRGALKYFTCDASLLALARVAEKHFEEWKNLPAEDVDEYYKEEPK